MKKKAYLEPTLSVLNAKMEGMVAASGPGRMDVDANEDTNKHWTQGKNKGSWSKSSPWE